MVQVQQAIRQVADVATIRQVVDEAIIHKKND